MGVDIYKVYNITQDQSMLITGHDIKNVGFMKITKVQNPPKDILQF